MKAHGKYLREFMTERRDKITMCLLWLLITISGYFAARYVPPLALIAIFPFSSWLLNLLTLKTPEIYVFLGFSILLSLLIYPFAPLISALVSSFFAGYIVSFVFGRWREENARRRAE